MKAGKALKSKKKPKSQICGVIDIQKPKINYSNSNYIKNSN